MEYQIIDVKEGSELSFCVVVNDRKDDVFVFENVAIHEPNENGEMMASCNLALLKMNETTREVVELTKEDEQFMQDLLLEIITNFVTESTKDLNKDLKIEQEGA